MKLVIDLDETWSYEESLCFATAEDAAAAARAMIAPLKLNGGEAGAALSTAARRQQPIWQATELQPRTKSG